MQEKKDVKKIISQMTLEEKAGICTGKDFWTTKDVERLGIPSIMMTDGPHGLRKQDAASDHLGIGHSIPSTCFPAGSAFACSFDTELVKELGNALGEECLEENVSIILGPAVNIKRSPLCGRNFEYLSEDPYLSAQLAEAHINGVQEKGVGTSIKHYAVNNQEHKRMTVSAELDERVLREIYLASFEGPIKNAKPDTVMCAYNLVNGVYCSEDSYLMTDILRDEWGYEGFVMTDWGAINNRVKGLAAGIELEMPGTGEMNPKMVAEAVNSGELSMETLDKAVERILNIVFKAEANLKEGYRYDKDEHNLLARKIAGESMVLLKNDNILPIKKGTKVAFIGEFAESPRYQGGGSSHINPIKLTSALEAGKEYAGDDITYSRGFDVKSDDTDEKLFLEAIQAAKSADTAVMFAGLPDRYESEGYDRTHMRIPANQIRLIEEVSKVQKNLVVVLHNGSPVEMPWLDCVKGLLDAYLSGQASGGAVVDLLYGVVNPSGKLAETFPIKLSDNPSYLNFPGEGNKVEYKEGLFVGYRYYDKKECDVLFPFGYGLSYTTFSYSDMKLCCTEINDTDTMTVSLNVKNTGAVYGKEIVQLYVGAAESAVIRPIRELKGFAKVGLAPGEEKEVSFTLDKRSFAYYNTQIKDWHVETGEYIISVGRSSRDIELEKRVKVNSTVHIPLRIHTNSTISELQGDPIGQKVLGMIMQAQGGAPTMPDLGEDNGMKEMMEKMMMYMPLRAAGMFTGNVITEEQIQMLVKAAE